MKAWLFDIDGVITDPIEKRITEPEILVKIIKRLKRGEPVGLNTGRSINFVIQEVLIPLENQIEDRSHLNNVIAIGEKGGVNITYKDGERTEEIDGSISVPQTLLDEVRELVKNQFSDIMFFDETKKTMISVEMKKGIDLAIFHQRQTKLNQELKKLLEKHNSAQLKIDPSTIATDIENSHVGKARGVDRFLRLLSEKGIIPESFTAFGDSNSDLEMIEPLRSTGKKIIFVYVGKPTNKTDPEIITTKSMYSAGTLEYLQAN